MLYEVITNRARKRGPVVMVTTIMDRNLLALNIEADNFHQVRTWELKRFQAIKEQTYLDSLTAGQMGVMEKERVYGQTKLEF